MMGGVASPALQRKQSGCATALTGTEHELPQSDNLKPVGGAA